MSRPSMNSNGVSTSAWVAWGVQFPGVYDAHITLAFFPEVWEYEGGVNGGIGILTEELVRLLRFQPERFMVKTLDTVAFTSPDKNHFAYAVKVELPGAMQEVAESFRSRLYTRDLRYSTEFEFVPHITIEYVNKDSEPKFTDPIPGQLLVKTLFLDVRKRFSDHFPERMTWRLRKESNDVPQEQA